MNYHIKNIPLHDRRGEPHLMSLIIGMNYYMKNILLHDRREPDPRNIIRELLGIVFSPSPEAIFPAWHRNKVNDTLDERYLSIA